MCGVIHLSLQFGDLVHQGIPFASISIPFGTLVLTQVKTHRPDRSNTNCIPSFAWVLSLETVQFNP